MGYTIKAEHIDYMLKGTALRRRRVVEAIASDLRALGVKGRAEIKTVLFEQLKAAGLPETTAGKYCRRIKSAVNYVNL